jgi:hypothetical protein
MLGDAFSPLGKSVARITLRARQVSKSRFLLRSSGGTTVKIWISPILFVLLLFVSATAVAKPVIWNLQNAVFNDGGTATGYFVFEPNTNTIVSYNIATSGGDTATFPGFTFQNGTPDNTGSFYDQGDGYLLFDTDLQCPFQYCQGQNYLQLRLPVGTLPGSGTVVFDLSNVFQGECYNCDPWRPFVSGDVTSAVPEPSTLTLLATGLLGSIALIRRKLL